MVGGVCMNAICASSNSVEWKKGWPLRSGGFATLCDNCGTVYQDLVFCETFHSEETGWRECTSCGKRLHCGCVASSTLLELLDTGGVHCKGCSKSLTNPNTPVEEKHKTRGLPTENDTRMVSALLGDDANMDCQQNLLPSQNANVASSKLEDDLATSGEIGYKLLLSSNQSPIRPSKNYDMFQESKSLHKSLVETNLSISLSASSNSNAGMMVEERQLNTAISSFQHGCRPRHLLPRVPTLLAAGLETNSSSVSQLRVARPPVEGRVKNQLLPRYWPRITDQELQQISGDSNSTIVPLFEKVLSASDAGRIGRLVLPKACAEAYFPPISQPEGLPLRIQDVKGKEWVFQFRFWPNNNSRMYVLEGVTPCIQSMQLQAGDTVTFSRMDPEGKLLMGFRKASSSVSVQKVAMQDSHYPIDIGAFQGDTLMGNAESLPLISGYSGLIQSLKGSRSPSMTLFPKHVYSANITPQITEKNMYKAGGDNLLAQSFGPSERKRRNIGAKSKRLLIDGHDSLELRVSWEEMQDMLRPPPNVEPSTVSVEDYEIEEFDEPPVFGKRSIFVVRLSGEQEQWTQCDSCLKWRKVPIDLLLPPKWTCHDNLNDQIRCSCSAPDEMDSRELENLLRLHKDFTKTRAVTSLKPVHHEYQSHDVEAPTNGGGNTSEAGASSVAATTKHPRHRPGCSCIVCIQPPSGKGKHKPTCTCNVCMTVKRRFKTLMMRKKKRQSEREAEIAQRNQFVASAAKEEAEVDSIPSQSDNARKSESEMILKCHSDGPSQDNAEDFNGGLDLNSCPGTDRTAPSRLSMMNLLQEASLPLDTYLKQNGLASLVSEQHEALTVVVAQPSEETTPQAREEVVFSAVVQEHEGSNELSDKDEREDDTL